MSQFVQVIIFPMNIRNTADMSISLFDDILSSWVDLT